MINILSPLIFTLNILFIFQMSCHVAFYADDTVFYVIGC